MSLIRLEILTDDEKLADLCRQYWDVGPEFKFAISVPDIAQKFGVKKHHIGSIVRSHCKAWSTSDTCTGCGSPYAYATRSDFLQCVRQRTRNWHCTACIERIAEAKRAAQSARDDRRRELILRRFGDAAFRRAPIDPMTLSLKDSVNLLSLLRVGATEDLVRVAPLNSFGQPLSGATDVDLEILRSMYNRNILYVDPQSRLDAFTYNDEDVVKTIYLDQVAWILSSDDQASYARALIAELETVFIDGNWPSRWRDEVLPLWMEIAVRECLQHLEVALDAYGFPMSAGSKTVSIIEYALKYFSIGQVIALIFSATKNAAAFYQRERVAKQHAANTVPGTIQRYADRALADRWDVRPYRREAKCPQSMISQVFFNLVLKIGNAALVTCVGDHELTLPDESDEPGE